MHYDEATALRALLSSTPDLIFFLDREGRYRFVGAAAAATVGQTPEAMLGRTPREIGIDSEASAKFEKQRLEVMRTGHAVRDESTIEGGDVFDYVIAPVAADGEPLGVVVVTREVTERRKAEEALRASEEKFSIAFGRSPLALTITSLDDGRLVEVNEGFERLSGYRRDEVVGRSPDELGLWVEPGQRAERFARLRAGQPVPDIEARFRIKSGEELIGLIGSAVVEINGRRCVLSSVTDITERKRAEQAKDEFLATLSHELRTPLTSGYGWVKLLSKAHDAELLENGLRAIEESLYTQIRLIDDLLDVSRIAAGKLRMETQALDLGSVLDAAVDVVRGEAEAKQIELRVRVQSVLTVAGDAARLRQVVWNLLTNAIKFTPAGGTVEIELRQREASAELVIRDSGEGIDPKFLPHVFDRFRQADSSISRRHGGLGIGLSIVASLVDAHNGSVRAHSEGIGKGATFTVTLPLLQTNAVRPMLSARAGDAQAHLGGAKVLVVDDDAGARQLMMATLSAAGAEVRECGNAGDAFAEFNAWRPHIVISDLAMPQEDGFSLIRRIRAADGGIPAVAITAYARHEDAERVRDAGFQRHIIKPFDPNDLIQAVRELV